MKTTNLVMYWVYEFVAGFTDYQFVLLIMLTADYQYIYYLPTICSRLSVCIATLLDVFAFQNRYGMT